MKVLIIANTAIKGKSIAANMGKVVDLEKEDAHALIAAGKARIPTEEDYARMSAGKGDTKEADAKKAAEKAAEKAAAKKEAAEKKAAEEDKGDWRNNIKDEDERKFADQFTTPGDAVTFAFKSRKQLSNAVTIPAKDAE